MSEALTESEVMGFLRAIERRETQLTCEEEPQDVYAGNVCYRAHGGVHDGWTLWVFNDCNEWDYVDSATSADGREFDFEDLGFESELLSYRPSVEVSWECYGIPGYLKTNGEPWSKR